jgi:hypothetical protein
LYGSFFEQYTEMASSLRLLAGFRFSPDVLNVSRNAKGLSGWELGSNEERNCADEGP